MPSAAPITWELTDHACAVCMGRVLRRVDEDRVVTLKCACCGIEGAENVQSICWCGFRLRAGPRVQRFRCQVNPDRTPEFPSVIEVVEL